MTRLRSEAPDPTSGEPRWTLVLGGVEASVVRSLPERLERLLGDPSANAAIIGRLFPASYDDPHEERAARQLLGESLLAERRELLASVREGLGRGKVRNGGLSLPLGPADMDLWMRFVNDLRLMLATELGVEANLDAAPSSLAGPDGPRWALLEYLGGFQALLLTALRPDLAGPFEGARDRDEDDDEEDDEDEDDELPDAAEDADVEPPDGTRP